jgi:opine dehydrogenase
MKKIAVLGAGNGGYACSADLSLAGYEVNLHETPRFRENIEPILKRGGIEISGLAREGFAKLNRVTTDIKEAVKDVELILIVVPAFAQKHFAESCIPYLENGQCVVFLGKGGGTLEFAKIMKKLCFKKDILLGEANTLPYATRRTGPAEVEVFCRVKKLFVAALPARNNQKLVEALKEIYPSVVPVSNVLETMLNDINGILHPIPTILNASRIEYTKGDFYIYREGFTPVVMKVIEAVDKERLQVVKALGLKQITFEELYLSVGFGPEAPLLESITHCYGASNMKSPGSLQSRYFTEDVPYGLVPMASLGQFVGVETPTIKSVIKLASIINQTDYWEQGRNVQKLGIAQLSISDLQRFLTEGKI